jgi:hypothetical protein
MHNKLQGRTYKLEVRKQLTIEKLKPERTINICKISYLAFYINFKYSKNTLLSLYKLDCELEDRK